MRVFVSRRTIWVMPMPLNKISGTVVDAALKIHRILGPGLLESVYEAVLAHELEQRGLHVERQYPVPIAFDEIRMEITFHADLLVEGWSSLR